MRQRGTGEVCDTIQSLVKICNKCTYIGNHTHYTGKGCLPTSKHYKSIHEFDFNNGPMSKIS